LRLRRLRSLRLIGAATVEAIRARILQEVDGVQQALIIENRDMKQINIEVIFESDFSSNNVITFEFNGVPLQAVSFDTDQLTTMNLIIVELQAQNFIENVTLSANERELNIEFVSGFAKEITDIGISGDPIEFNIRGGRFPKSFETIVQGGSDSDIANKIWQTKPAGIQTFGNTTFIITDSQGDQHGIRFSRPNQIFVWIDLQITLNPNVSFPSNGIDLVTNALVDFGNTLNIGENVFFQQLLCQIFEVQGVASGDMEIGGSVSGTVQPTLSTDNIIIDVTEIAVFSSERINITIA
jgi:hypothetical protein